MNPLFMEDRIEISVPRDDPDHPLSSFVKPGDAKLNVD